MQLSHAQCNQLIQYLIKKLAEQFGLACKIGFELEFYLIGKDFSLLTQLLADFTAVGLNIVSERGQHQYEYIGPVFDDLTEAASDIEHVKLMTTKLANKYQLMVDYSAKPNAQDYGSALQINLSLYNQIGENIFGARGIAENILLQRCIAGILDLTPEAVALLCINEQDFLRLNQPQFMAPSHIAWGGNNRTTVIRIPISPKEERRIEYRLAPASANALTLTYITILGAWHGLKQDLIPPKQIFGNAYDPQYQLQSLPLNSLEAKNSFYKKGNIAYYTQSLSKIIE